MLSGIKQCVKNGALLYVSFMLIEGASSVVSIMYLYNQAVTTGQAIKQLPGVPDNDWV